MSVTVKALVESKYVEITTPTTQYTANNGRTIIDKFTMGNSTLTAVTVFVSLVPAGGTAGPANMSVQKTLQGLETYTFPEVVGHTLMPGDFITAFASAASAVTVRASGREIT